MTTHAIRKTEPRYVLVASRLLDEIDSGVYPVGSLLPTESELMERFDVSRHTAREAMRELQSRGLVVRRPGIGTRVVSKQTRRAFAHSLSSIEDVHQFATRTRLIDVSVEDRSEEHTS